MKIAVFTYSRQGCTTARRVLSCFPDDEIQAYTIERFCEYGFLPLEKPSAPFYGRLFDWADALIFVGSCGIAVRAIAPHIRDKRTDPAVICIDERAVHVIPLLSGHIGGANELAQTLSETLGATAVITTATDINNKFSVDAWAAKHGYIIDSMPLAKAVSAEILERNVPLCSDLKITTNPPKGVEYGSKGKIGIYIGWEKKSPFDNTLRLIPPVLHLGIGCRKGTDAETIGNTVDAVLETCNIDKRAVKSVASIDLKSEEEGLLSYCRENGWQVNFYSAEKLRSVQGEFTPSSFVQRVTGVDNVCERSAMINADRLIVQKTAANGVTVAIAAEKAEICFG